MMQIVLNVREDDFDKYLNGEEIEAAKGGNASIIFNKNREEIVEVILPITEIVSRETKEVNGMIKGTFRYYIIKKG